MVFSLRVSSEKVTFQTKTSFLKETRFHDNLSSTYVLAVKPSSRMTLALLIYKCVVDVFVNEVFKVSLNNV